MRQYKGLETAQAKVRANAAAKVKRLEAEKAATKDKETDVLRYAAQKIITDALNKRWLYWVEVYKPKGHELEQTYNLAKAAAILEAIIKLEAVNIHSRVYCLIEQISTLAIISEMKYFPKNPRRIKQKIDLFKSGLPIEQVIKLPRQGNENRKGYKVSKGGKVVQSRQIKDTFIEQCF